MIYIVLPYIAPITKFDLVDEMEYEDNEDLFITLEDAGLENKLEYDTVPGALKEYFDNEC